MGVRGHLSLVHHTIFVVMQEFDRVLDSQDVVVTLNVDLVDHRCEGSRFTRTGRSGYEDQASRLFAHVGDDLRQAKAFGIRGVPFYVFNERYAVSGAQQPDVFLQALRKARSEGVSS